MWMEETCVDFPILLDPGREAYEAYGFHRSYLRAWGPKTFFTYVKLLISGRKWRGIQEDSAQLGGGCDHRRGFHHTLHPPEYGSLRSTLRRDSAPRALIFQDHKIPQIILCEIRASPPI